MHPQNTPRRKFLILLLAATSTSPSFGGAQHQNQVMLIKTSATALRFDFQISPALWLHKVMQPLMSFPDFLNAHASLPELQFQKILGKGLHQLELENFVQLPSGEKLALRQWQLPPVAELQALLQKNLLILNLPPQIQAHLEPIAFSASVKSRKPLGRVQLTLSTAFHPILAQYDRDSVWFTPQLPSSLFDL
jgi:hypothetical protein